MKYSKRLLFGSIMSISVIINASEDVTIQPGVVLQDTPVYEEPDRHSNVLYEIKEDSKVYIKERHKSWYKVDAKNREPGWLRLLTIRYLGDPKQSYLGEMSNFSSNVFNVQRGGPVVTTGVRGIDEEDFRAGEPDYVMADIIMAQTSNKSQIVQFAKQQNLVVKDIIIPDSSAPKKEKKND